MKSLNTPPPKDPHELWRHFSVLTPATSSVRWMVRQRL